MRLAPITPIIAVLLCCVQTKTQAQIWEFGVMAGGATYFGDLNPKFNLRFPSGGANILLRRNFDGRICLKGAANFARVWADDKKSPEVYQKARNLSFHSNVLTGSFQIEFNFQPYHSTQLFKDKRATPYLTTGLGLTWFNPYANLQGGNYELRAMGTEGQAPGSEYKTVAPSWAIGGGFKFDLGRTRNWSFNIEIMAQLLFTDYLDDVHGTYADVRVVEGHHGTAAALLSDRSIEISETRLGGVGRQRGNSKDRDMYMTANIGFVYRFLSLSCPAY
jgi:Domain of unknown function (DUF6089)